METLVRTPQAVFMQPQRLIVPLFQRPYVWSEERQWEPLWNDVVRVAERLRARPTERPVPHFLGAVVLQQVPTQAGLIAERTIIDGQQRLTTLQLLMDALHAELERIKAVAPAARLEPLTENAAPFRTKPEDRFKVWPTNRDRPAFNAVMAAPSPVDHDKLPYTGEKMVEAHRYFSEQAREWLMAEGEPNAPGRAAIIETVVRELLLMVVIDLGQDENAQEIFETLNDRGAPLTAADLIKNFVFQKLLESGSDVEVTYDRNWKEFETAFWEKEVSVGRLYLSRSSVFLNHWLVAMTGTEVVAREVFARFKSFVGDNGQPMTQILEQVRRAADVYRKFVESAESTHGPLDRVGLFGYRTGMLESEVVKPLILCLLDPELPPVPAAQVDKALTTVESWMVRRMLVRATTKNYNQVIAEIILSLRSGARLTAGDAIEERLRNETSEARYWPDDDEIRREIQGLQAYRRLSRGRLRMVLEAIEDRMRGWHGQEKGLGGERVSRGSHAIEHVMPRKWATHWGELEGFRGEQDRDGLVHTLGNLTLLTARLNSKVSNGPWSGEGGKRAALERHDVLFLNRDILKRGQDAWTDDQIRRRTDAMAEVILELWPAPAGHRSPAAHKPRVSKSIQLVDLIDAGLLKGGMTLYPRSRRFIGRTATLLTDGQVEVEGKIFPKPFPAASAMAGHPVNGWHFFLVDPVKRVSLADLLRKYVDDTSVDANAEAFDDGEDEDEPKQEEVAAVADDEDDDDEDDGEDREFWEDRIGAEGLAAVDVIFALIKELNPHTEPNYRRAYIGVTLEGRSLNFVSIQRRKAGLLLNVSLDQSPENLALVGTVSVLGAEYKRQVYRLLVDPTRVPNQVDALRALVTAAYRSVGTRAKKA